jgi:hypothetical protein
MMDICVQKYKIIKNKICDLKWEKQKK